MREALPELQAQPNITLEALGLSDGALVSCKMYVYEARAGSTVEWDVATREFR